MRANYHSPAFLLLLATATVLICLPMSQSGKSTDKDGPTVKISNGQVKGLKMVSGHGKELDGFLGIPYAKPPVGELRFRRPELIEPWKDVLDATKLPNSCVQTIDMVFGTKFRGSNMWNPNTPVNEDCLYLSVYVPKPGPKDGAVLVWIHGGGFYSGTSTLDVYDPKILCSEKEIIIVSINYRLASLGFLFFDRPDAPGNVGLFDQLMALEWVRDNIGYFGGDPKKVTIFGQSAGAGSVSFHLISPLSRNVFTHAVLESGSSLAPWATRDKEEAIKRGLHLAEVLGCPNDRSQLDAVLDCLRTKDAEEIITKEWDGITGILNVPFTPVVDGVFLTETPNQTLATGNFEKKHILLGSNSEEGNYFLMYSVNKYFKKEEEVYISRDQFVDIVKNEMYTCYGELGQAAILFEYTNWDDPDDPVRNRDAVDKMVGDVKFVCPTNDFALQFAEAGSDVYMYYFSQRSSINPWPGWSGVLHADEINFVFGEPLNETFGYTKLEKELSEKMMRYWVNFARTGNPNIQLNGEREPLLWPLHTPKIREYMTLAVNSHEVGKARRAKECIFWGDFLPNLLQTTGYSTDC